MLVQSLRTEFYLFTTDNQSVQAHSTLGENQCFLSAAGIPRREQIIALNID